MNESRIIEKNGKRELIVGKPPFLLPFYNGCLDQYFWNLSSSIYRLKIFIHLLENYNKNGAEYIGLEGLRELSGGRDRQVKLYVSHLKKDGFIKIVEGFDDLRPVFIMAQVFNDKRLRSTYISYMKKEIRNSENKLSS